MLRTTSKLSVELLTAQWVVAMSVLFPAALHAESLAKDVKAYDLESLMWAVVMAVMGGGLRTIFTLATDATVVMSFGREMIKDAAVAMIAGALAYIVLEALRSFGAVPLASEVRFAVIIFAGWSRLSFFGWLDRLGTKVTTSIEDRVQAALGKKE